MAIPRRKSTSRTTSATRAKKAVTPKKTTASRPAPKKAAPSFDAQMAAASQRSPRIPSNKPATDPDTFAGLTKSLKAAFGGKRVTLLEVPWEERDIARSLGGEWVEKIKNYVYVGDLLPERLQNYASKDYSYFRWIEDQINGRIKAVPKPVDGYYTPKPHQVEAIENIRETAAAGWRGYLEADSTGLGKGLHGATLIPTPSGFVSMHELQVGDMVLGADGKPTKILAKYLSKAEKFYKITFSDGSIVKADADHRWLTSSATERLRKAKNTVTRQRISNEALQNLRNNLLDAQEKFLGVTYPFCYEAIMQENAHFIRDLLSQIKPVGNIGMKKVYHPQEVLEKLETFQLHLGNKWGTSAEYSSVKNTEELFKTQQFSIGKSSTRVNHSIKITNPIEGMEQNLPINPYVLGAWLGDGSARQGMITSADPEIAQYIDEYFPVGTVTATKSKAVNYRFEGLTAALRKLYGSPNPEKIIKRIPAIYLAASKNQRLELLKGLLDTDGSIASQDGQGVTFSQKDETLFFQVYSLICSLGWKATWRKKDIPFIYKGVSGSTYAYELHFYPDEQVFKLERKACALEVRLDSFKKNIKNKLRYITKIEEIEKDEDYYCISVDAPDHLYLCTESYIPTHNTISGLMGASEVAKLRGFSSAKKAKVLIICPNGAIAHWRNTVRHLPIDNIRVMIVNYESYKKLLTVPAAAKTAKKQKTQNKHISSKGKPFINWDIIISDESQMLKNFTAQRTQAFERIAQYALDAKIAPYVLWMSATAGQTPLELGYLCPLIGQAARTKITMESWPEWLSKNGFNVAKKGKTWQWVKPTGPNDAIARERQKQDVERLASILFHPKAPSIRRKPEDIEGWPPVTRVAMPIQLGNSQRDKYQQLWTEFRKEMNLSGGSKNPKSVLAVQLRFAQKASLLRVSQTVDNIIELLDTGHQVAVSVRFLESLDAIRAELKKQGIECSEWSGRTYIDKEKERIAFQKGQNKVILFTVKEAVSFHAKESLPDGSKASATPRALLIHDLRYSAMEMTQIIGRTHRDGMNSIAYFLYSEDTIEERIMNIMMNKLENMTLLSGDDEEDSIVEFVSDLLTE